MRVILTIVGFLTLIISCAKDDQVLFRINEKFTVYRSGECRCNTLDLTISESEKRMFLKDILVVMGNPEEFLVQTSTPNSAARTWVLVKSAQAKGPESIVALSKDEIDAILDTLKIEFVKDYSSQ